MCFWISSIGEFFGWWKKCITSPRRVTTEYTYTDCIDDLFDLYYNQQYNIHRWLKGYDEVQTLFNFWSFLNNKQIFFSNKPVFLGFSRAMPNCTLPDMLFWCVNGKHVNSIEIQSLHLQNFYLKFVTLYYIKSLIDKYMRCTPYSERKNIYLLTVKLHKIYKRINKLFWALITSDKYEDVGWIPRSIKYKSVSLLLKSVFIFL